MKRWFMLICLVLAFVLTACSPSMQGFVELPGGVKAGITALVLVAVSFFFAKLLTLFKWLKFLDGFREPLALAIAAELIGLIQMAVPDAWGEVAVLALQLVLAVLSVLGVFNVLKARGIKGFK